MEEDLRDALSTVVEPIPDARLAFGEDIADRAIERFKRDAAARTQPPIAADLIEYLDFAESFMALNRNHASLPAATVQALRIATPKLELLVPIRNRVMHARPLHFEDLPYTIDTANLLLKEIDFQWHSLIATSKRLKTDPSFVLGLKIPVPEQNATRLCHNLPIPDFDETGFLGRRDVVNAVTKLCLGAYPVITIVGEGGIGKTALALKVAFDVLDLDDCPYDAIVWTSSKTTHLTSHDIRTLENSIATSLGMLQAASTHLSGQQSDDPLTELLAYLAEFRVLVVLDNLENVLDDTIRTFLSLLPSGSKILITSRIGVGAFEYPVKLEPLKEDESIQLLRATSKIRGVNQLTAMPSKQLAVYCRRMKHNPLFIKWFVSSVQAGVRPETALGAPETFLVFAMSNVYDFLSPESKQVLAALITVPGRHSQAELTFLTELEVEVLQRALQLLLTTHMVAMSSVPIGSSFETSYSVSELARQFLIRHYPPSASEHAAFIRRRKQLVATSEDVAALEKVNRYSFYCVSVRTSNDRIVARYLHDALNASRRGDSSSALAEVAQAKSLAPAYFEVHRVEALVCVQAGNVPGAQTAYEAAIELEPQYAPLRMWYGGFRMRYLDDLQGALEEFRAAEKLDPESNEVQREVGTALLYLRDYDGARMVFDRLTHDTALADWPARKCWDLYLQAYTREADEFLGQREYSNALERVSELSVVFDRCPPMLVDSKMRSKLAKAIGYVERCMQGVHEKRFQERCVALRDRLLVQTGAIVEASLGGDADGGDHSVGRVSRVFRDGQREFGFLVGNDGKEWYFCRRDFVDDDEWWTIAVGSEVVFERGANVVGPCARRVRVQVDG